MIRILKNYILHPLSLITVGSAWEVDEALGPPTRYQVIAKISCVQVIRTHYQQILKPKF